MEKLRFYGKRDGSVMVRGCLGGWRHCSPSQIHVKMHQGRSIAGKTRVRDCN